MSHLRKCAGVNKPRKSLLTSEELDKELKEFAKFDLEAELKRLNTNVDLDKTFKLPE
jgi:hypothetical protein